MKKKELPEKKHFFTIGEVSDYLDLPESTLRYWEKIFPQVSPKRYGGERRYTRKDIEQIENIYFLLKVQKMTIEGAKKYLSKKRKEFVLKDYELIQELNELKQKLEWLKKMLEENGQN